MRHTSNDRQEIDAICSRADLMQQGTSKADARADIQAQLGSKDFHSVGGQMGFHSFRTANDQKQAMSKFYSYCKTEYKIDGARNCTPKMVYTYLKDCQTRGLATSTIQRNIVPALQKFDDAINKCYGSGNDGKPVDFSTAISRFADKFISNEPAKFIDRAYNNPTAVVSALPDTVRVSGELQLQCGLRISSACYLVKIAPGDYVANTKEGQKFIVHPSSDLCDRIDSKLNGNVFKVSQKLYRSELKDAATRSGENYSKSGTHGLRYNFAQEQYTDLIDKGFSIKESRMIVSENLGHHRDYMGPYLGK